MIKYIIYKAKFLAKEYVGWFEYTPCVYKDDGFINSQTLDINIYKDASKKDFYLNVPDFIDDCEKLNYKLFRDRFYKVENYIKELENIIKDDNYKDNEFYQKMKKHYIDKIGIDKDETKEELMEELESLREEMRLEKEGYCEKSVSEILKENVYIEILFNKRVGKNYNIRQDVKEYIKKYNTVIYGYNSIEDIDGEIDDLFNYQDGNYIVYKHTSPKGKSYIGITKNETSRRWGKNGNNYKPQTKFWNAIKKYGWDNFTHEILEENLSLLTASEKERYYIKKYDAIKNGYNVDEGGLKRH